MATGLRALLATRHEYRVLGLMLILLHSAVWWDFGGALSRSLMVAHLGLFLLWQPVWSRDMRLAGSSAVVFVLATAAFIAWINYWLVIAWLLMLVGLVGGRVTVSRADRYAHMLALLFLVCELLIGCIPPVFAEQAVGSQVHVLFGQGLLALPVALLFVPGQQSGPDSTRPLDLLYGLTMSMLATILGLGSLLGMYYTGAPYPVALFQTVLAIAVFLLAISWLWMPLAGFSGLGQLWERYLLNIGTPFESWLARLANLAEEGVAAAELLAEGMRQFVALPWVAGVDWHTAAEGAAEGERTAHSFHYATGGLDVTVYSHRPMGVALLLHGKLLIQLVAHFYRAKLREQELAQRAHLHAIYETGARVTHDIKNLLQSLHTMTSAVESADAAHEDDVQRLIRRQLPHVTRRLRLALDKLQTPATATLEEQRLSTWWRSLENRHASEHVRLEAVLSADPVVPADLLDSVVENLLENARIKRQSEPDLQIGVELQASEQALRLSVSDDGSPVDPAVARELFRGPVRSRQGLGIGLYQAARQAERLGYRLRLARTAQGARFELTKAPAGGSPPARAVGER